MRFSPSCRGWAPPSVPSGRIRIRRPRGIATGAAAVVAPAMNIVRGGPPTVVDEPEGCLAIRVPQPPQKANPIWTILPQVGQGISPAGAGAAPPVARSGPGVPPRAPTALAPPEVERGAGAGPASGFGGSWKGTADGILGESPQGMPPRILGTAGEELRSSPATVAAIGPGGSTVRAVSSEGSMAGIGAGFTSSLPQPRQNL